MIHDQVGTGDTQAQEVESGHGHHFLSYKKDGGESSGEGNDNIWHECSISTKVNS